MSNIPSSFPSTLVRRAALSLVAVSALWLAGCASSVKLDENAGKAPVIDSSVNAGSSGGASTAVATVTGQTGNVGDLIAGLPRTIYFDFDSYVVRDDARATVEGYAKVLTTKKGKITLEGHTDDRGGREYNLALGQKRAEATARSLSLLGVSAEQVEAVSFGKERPAVEGQNEEAWAKNRRVEFKAR